MHARFAVNGGSFFAYVPLLGGPRSCQRITESTMCVGVLFSGKCVLSSNVILFVLMQQRSVSIVALALMQQACMKCDVCHLLL